ncbi:MAG: TlpA family protein disulfide reductase [Bacteroidales bacterium]
MRSTHALVVASALIVASSPFVVAIRAHQAPAATVQQLEPKTIGECLEAARTYTAKKYQQLRAAGQTPDVAKLTEEATALAKQYASRFSIDTAAVQDLTPLARLYMLAKQPDLANQAIKKALSAPGATEPDKANALVAAVEMSMGSPVTDDGIKAAEGYCAQLDAMAGVTSQKIQAHARLGSYFRAVDVDDKIFAHGNKVIELARTLPADERQKQSRSLAGSYVNVAEVYGGWEQADKAIAILEQGLKDLGTGPDVSSQLQPTIERYRLVGTIAPPVEAPNWLNAPAGTTKLDVKGTVSVIQFTAHWCGPCRKSYPSTLRLHNTWAPKGLQVIFATELYGFLGTQRSLTAEQEIAADKKYFVEEHGIPFKIAIEPQRQPQARGAAPSANPTNSDRYKVAGIPHIVVTDKQGKIRLIVIGWDPAAEARLNKLVERLLAEKTTP